LEAISEKSFSVDGALFPARPAGGAGDFGAIYSDEASVR
jgi:hypothetical protein